MASQTNFNITLGGTAETLLSARLGRSYLSITPVDEDCWIRFNGTAAVDAGELCYQGSPTQFSVERFPEIGGEVSIYSATTGADVTIREV